MGLRILSYDAFDLESVSNEVNSENILVVYDKKPNKLASIELLDFNTFRFLTWKNSFIPKIERKIMFLTKKITDDFWYSFFRNIYDDVYIFTDDIENIERIFKPLEKNVEIFFYDKNLIFEPKYFEESEFQRILDFFIDFVCYNIKFSEIYSDHIQKNNVSVHLPNAISGKVDYKLFPPSKYISENEDHICLSYLFDPDYEYSQYKKTIFLISNKTMNGIDYLSLEYPSQEMFYNLISNTQTIGIIINELSTFENFCFYLDTLKLDLINQIMRKTSLNIKHFPFIKPRECHIGDVTFPIDASRLFLDHIILCIRRVFEKSFIFLKSIIPCTSYLKGGFLNKEYQASVSLPGIFDFKVFSGFFISKKEALADACTKFIEILVEREILTKNLHVNEDVLLKLNTIQSLLLKAYSTSNLKDIELFYQDFVDQNIEKMKASKKVIEVENEVKLVEEDMSILVHDTFKRNVLIDLNTIENIEEEQIGDLSGIPENLNLENRENHDLNIKNSIKKPLIHSENVLNKNSNSQPKIPRDSKTSSFFNNESSLSQLERKYRKIPYCFTISTNAMSLYTFSNSYTGILCAESPLKTCTLFNEAQEAVEISYSPAKVYSEREIQVLKFYQIIFFKIRNEFLPSKTQSVLFHYYVVPLNDSKEIDWQYLNNIYDHFLQNFVYSDYNSKNLIWNPFTGEFLLIKERSERLIEDRIGDTTFLDVFQKSYNISLNFKEGQVLVKAFSIEEVVSSLKKLFNKLYSSIQQSEEQLNKSLLYSICNLDDNTNSEIKTKTILRNSDTSNEFQIAAGKIYIKNEMCESGDPDNPKISENTSDVCQSLSSNINQSEKLIDSALKGVKNPSIYSAECCFITPLKKSILVETQIFKRNYKLIEDLFIALELREAFDLNLDLVSIIQCFTLKSENLYLNYERLEFLGDCVLKFLSTNHLFLNNYDIDKIVSFKDTIVCNANLFNCCVNSGIFRYLKTSKFNPKMIQAPSLDQSNDLVDYFQANMIFKSDNYLYFGTKAFDPEEVAIKMYADMIEALIGSLFLSNGIKDAYSFIKKLGIIKSDVSNSDDTILTEKFLESLLDQSSIENPEISKIKQAGAYDIKTKDLQNVSNQLDILNNHNGDVLKEYFMKKNSTNQVSSISNLLNTENINMNLEVSNKLSSSRIKINNISSIFYGSDYFYYEYREFVNGSEIESLERIIGYRFSNPGNIERAIVHPSYTALFGFKDFQYLELIGDCSLDLFVNFLIFQNESLNSPLYLHSAKKSYVNNISLRNLYYKYGFDKCTKLNIFNMPSSKAYSDMIEAIIGAIMIDVQWDYCQFSQIMSIKFKGMLEDCKAEFNLDQRFFKV